MRIPLYIIFLIIIGMGLTSCSPRKIPADTLVLESSADAVILNPILNADSASSEINSFVFDSLIQVNDKLQFEPALAASWSVSGGGLKWRFDLVHNAKWHDGAPFTSKDVVFTIQSILDPKVNSPRKSDYELIESITAPDDYTVEIKLKKKFAPFLESMGIGILPEHLLKGHDINTDTFNQHPVGTGKYVFKEWKKRQYITLAKYDDYYGKKPKIEKVKMKIVADSNVGLLQMRTGEVDLLGIEPKDYELVSSFKNSTVYKYEALNYTYIGFNLKNPILSDKKVRQALAYGYDRKPVIDKIIKGLGTEANSTMSPLSWAYNPDVPKYNYDPKKAAQLLDEAGWKLNNDGYRYKDGKKLKFTLMTSKGNKTREDILQYTQQEWKAIGVDVDVMVVEWASFIGNYIDKRNFDAVILGWSLSIDPDPYQIFHSSQIEEPRLNFVGFNNAKADKLMEDGRTTIDIEQRKKIYQKLQAVIAEEEPYMLLYYPISLVAINNRIQNVTQPTAAGILLHQDDWVISEK